MRKRTNAILLRLSDAELDALNTKVAKANIPREKYCRMILNGSEVKEAPHVDVPQLIREVRRVGSNINQILLIANARGLLDVPELRKALLELREVEKRIVSSYR